LKKTAWNYLFLFLFITALANLAFFECSYNRELKKAREKLMLIASNASVLIDTDTLMQIPLRQDADKTPEYKFIFNKLDKIKEANPVVKYIYIMAATDKAGIFQYIVDADPLPEIVNSKSPTSFPGDEFNAERTPGMLEAFHGPSADKNIISDSWGVTLSGYAPIYDSLKKPVAILCVDMDASVLKKNTSDRIARLLLVIVAGIICFFVLRTHDK